MRYRTFHQVSKSRIEERESTRQKAVAKVREYPELQQDEWIFFEQDIKMGMKAGTLGVRIASDGGVGFVWMARR